MTTLPPLPATVPSSRSFPLPSRHHPSRRMPIPRWGRHSFRQRWSWRSRRRYHGRRCHHNSLRRSRDHDHHSRYRWKARRVHVMVRTRRHHRRRCSQSHGRPMLYADDAGISSRPPEGASKGDDGGHDCGRDVLPNVLLGQDGRHAPETKGARNVSFAVTSACQA